MFRRLFGTSSHPDPERIVIIIIVRPSRQTIDCSCTGLNCASGPTCAMNFFDGIRISFPGRRICYPKEFVLRRRIGATAAAVALAFCLFQAARKQCSHFDDITRVQESPAHRLAPKSRCILLILKNHLRFPGSFILKSMAELGPWLRRSW